MKDNMLALLTALVGITVSLILMAALFAADKPARARVAKEKQEKAALAREEEEEEDTEAYDEVNISEEDSTSKKSADQETDKKDSEREASSDGEKTSGKDLKLVKVKSKKLKLVLGDEGNAKEGGYSNIFSEPDEDSDVIDRMTYNNAVMLAKEQPEEDDEWTAVEARWKGKVGYVLSDTIRTQNITICNTGDDLRDNIVYRAYSHMGTKFKMHGTDLDTGFDCSHYIHYVFGEVGLDIPDTPKAIFASGKEIDEKDAKPGDIVFYDVNNGYGHVALYIGDGLAINTTGHNGKTYPKGGVHITALTYKDREEYKIANIIDQ